MSLLPLDPPPFTIPTTSGSMRKDQPTVSLTDYPLPDGTWRWVSREWMIDMRGDGQVQYDGFEYAWSFRSKKWRPTVGILSSGGWVRRRRWVRLMVRPAKSLRTGVENAGHPINQSDLLQLAHIEAGATRPPSVATSLTEDAQTAGDVVWRGDEDDWVRCHAALKALGRDGRRLELWQRWLGLPVLPVLPSIELDASSEGSGKEQAKQLQSNEDDSLIQPIEVSDDAFIDEIANGVGASPEVAPLDYLAKVLRAHGADILKSFVYPDSRARWLTILEKAGVVEEVYCGLSVSDSRMTLDFWSYAP
ncbi:hypothetical protein BKA93DRAFT_756996 [Sparassis latifolia]